MIAERDKGWKGITAVPALGFLYYYLPYYLSFMGVVCVIFFLWKPSQRVRVGKKTGGGVNKETSDDVRVRWGSPAGREEASDVHYPKDVPALLSLIEDAKKRNTTITVRGAGYSLGLQCVPPNRTGIIVDMTGFNHIVISADQRQVTVGAGAIWRDVIRALNEKGLAPIALQGFKDFSVGGSISVCAHGWEMNDTVASTIVAMKMVTMRGEEILVDREKNNPELFPFIPGSYGLIAIIVEATLKIRPNELLHCIRERVSFTELLQALPRMMKESSKLCYRTSVGGAILPEGVLEHYTVCDKKGRVSRLSEQSVMMQIGQGRALSIMSRSSRMRDFVLWSLRLLGQKAEENIETNMILWDSLFSLTKLHDREATWLQEFFIPITAANGKSCALKIADFQRFAIFVSALSSKAEHNISVLNVTIRFVKGDSTSKLSPAPTDSLSLVVCFVQKLSEDMIKNTQRWAERLINEALKYGGRPYMPYMCVPMKDFVAAYGPQAVLDMIEKKKEYDPDGILSSGFIHRYLGEAARNYARSAREAQRRPLVQGIPQRRSHSSPGSSPFLVPCPPPVIAIKHSSSGELDELERSITSTLSH
jgi:decaprenylphospho-beta-D-ribofuranose 2-oxidase